MLQLLIWIKDLISKKYPLQTLTKFQMIIILERLSSQIFFYFKMVQVHQVHKDHLQIQPILQFDTQLQIKKKDQTRNKLFNHILSENIQILPYKNMFFDCMKIFIIFSSIYLLIHYLIICSIYYYFKFSFIIVFLPKLILKETIR